MKSSKLHWIRILVILTFFLLVVGAAVAVDLPTKWGSWKEFEEGLQYRLRCESYNKFSKKYVWEAEVRNMTGKTVAVSAKVIDVDDDPDSEKGWQRHTLGPKSSQVFHLQFLKSGPGSKVRFVWRKIAWK